MEINILNMESDDAKLLFPDIVCGIICKPSTSVFAAVEENEILAAAVVSAENAFIHFTINYIYLRQDQPVEVLTELMDSVEQQCSKNGETAIAVKLIGSYNEWASIHQFLIDDSYMPVSFEGQIISYPISKILHSNFAGKREQLASMMKNVHFYNDLNKAQIVQLKDCLKNEFMGNQFTIPDLVFGRYYVVDGELMGYMDASELAPNLIWVSDLYVKRHEKTKYAFALMLAALLDSLSAFMAEDTSVCICTYSGTLKAAFASVFGEPEYDYHILEYCKKL